MIMGSFRTEKSYKFAGNAGTLEEEDDAAAVNNAPSESGATIDATVNTTSNTALGNTSPPALHIDVSSTSGGLASPISGPSSSRSQHPGFDFSPQSINQQQSYRPRSPSKITLEQQQQRAERMEELEHNARQQGQLEKDLPMLEDILNIIPQMLF